MKLRELLEGIPVIEMNADPEMEISGVSYDSRLTKPGDLFVAITGFASDGNRFIPMAMEKGASVVGGNIENINKDITDLKAATAGHTTDIKNITDGIAAMDFSKEVSTGNVRGKLVQVDGVITEFELSGNDIASAAELAQYKTDNNAALAGVKATADTAVQTASVDCGVSVEKEGTELKFSFAELTIDCGEF